MKKSLTRSTYRIISFCMVVAVVAFGTSTAYMQKAGAPQLAKPDIPVVKDVEMTFVEGAERTANRLAAAPGETRTPQTVGAKPRTIQPKTFGVCDTAGPIEVESSGGVVVPTAYATLGAAFAAINAGTHTGTITIDVAGDTAEGATSAVLNASGAGLASYTSITMSPCGGGARTISGATTAGFPLIDLNGADNVTIDGLNTGGNSLTISNTTASPAANTSTIRFIGGATNNLVTRSSIQGSFSGTIATNGGTIYFSTDTVALTGNDNNTVSFCNIGPAGANLPSKAIYALGTTTTLANENSGVLINNNNVFDFFRDVNASGVHILSGNDNWTISNNRIYQTAARAFATAASRYAGITLNSTLGTLGAFMVSGNTIGFGAANGTGTTTISGSSNEVRGIDAAGINTAVATNLQNNTISGINQTSSRASAAAASSAFIAVAMGTNDGLINATGNTIGSLDGSSTIVINETSITAGTAPVLGLYNVSFSSTNISSNNIGAITIQSTGTVVGFRGILVNTSVGIAATINNNTIGGAVAGGAITDTQVGNYAMYGIQVTLPNASMTGNLIRNFSGNANGAVVTMGGIILSGSTGVNTISQNTVHSLKDTVTGGVAGSIYAIDCSLGTAANVVERNLVHSISVTSILTAYQVWGIVMRGTGTATFKNNMVRLGLDAAGSSITTGFSIAGIRDIAGATANYYHNSVYIGGTGVVSASNTYCLFSDVVTNTRNYQDNIFWNARSNVSGGIANAAIRVGGTAPNPAGLTSDFNDLSFSGTDGATGVFNALVVPTLAAWRLATGQDNTSFAADPQFIAPNGTAATGDLHIHPTNPTPIEGAGLLIGSVTDDFDGQTRSSLTPVDMGADAGNFVLLDISPPGISYTLLANTGLTSNRTLSATITDGIGVAGGGLLPRIYFKKSTDGAYVSTQGTMTGGTPQNGTYDFVINYALVGGGSVTAGDIIQYFVVAQDTLGNLSSNPAPGFSGMDVNTVNTPPPTPNSYTILTTFAGSLNVGTAEAITSLTNAAGLFEKLNAGTVSGNLTINLTSDLAGELGTNALNQQIEEGAGAGTFTVTIKPSGGAPRLVSGANAVGLITLNGADRVTIDGLNTGGNALTIRNTNITGATIRFITDASNNTIQNCTIEGATTSAGTGVIFIGAGASSTTGNDNNTITSNTIRDRSDAAGVPANLIRSDGFSATVINSNNVISNNTLKNFTTNGILTSSPATENWTISNNTIFQEAARATALTGINFGAVGAANTITQNTIRDLNTTGGATGISVGSALATTVSRNRIFNFPSAGSLTGITFTGSNSVAAAVTLVNNMVSIIPAGSASQTIIGIRNLGFIGNTFNAYFNTVLIGGTATGSATWACQRGTLSPTASTWNNNICFNNRTGGSVNHFAMGEQSLGSGTFTSNYNLFVGTGTTAANFMDRGTIATGTAMSFASWQATTGTPDLNSQASNPGVGNFTTIAMFVSGTDLHSLLTSPAISMGNPIGGITTDFDNDPRPASNPDVGADELVQAVAGVIPAGTYYNAAANDGDSLGGDVTVTNMLTLNGKLNTGAFTLTIGCNVTVIGAGASNYVIGNLKKNFCSTGTFNFVVGTANGFSPALVNVTAGTFPADFTVKATQGPQPNLFSPTHALQRYWTLTATGVTADLTFNYLDPTDIPGTANENTFVILKYDGAFTMPGGSVNTGANTATILGVSSFSDWTLGEPGAPTDVALNSFTADGYSATPNSPSGGVLLKWQTGYEVANLGFNIYRDEAGKRVRVTPGMVAGSALFVGARTVLGAGRSYVWRDTQGPSADAEYWLEAIDINGSSAWYGPVRSSGVKKSSADFEPDSKLMRDLGEDQTTPDATTPVETKPKRARMSAERLAVQAVAAGQPAVKIAVRREGWYRIAQSELVAAGLDPRVDPLVLQLMVDGQEQPINVLTGKDGRVSAVEFYGIGPDSPYTSLRTYWLAAGAQPGKRIEQVKSAGTASAGGSFPYAVERRDRTIYFPALRNGDKENFFGAVIARDPVDQLLTVQRLDTGSSAAATLEVALQGVTAVAHSVKVELNGSFAGAVSFISQSGGIGRFNVPPSLLKEGQNVVRLTSQGGQGDVSLVDYIRLTYPHRYTADSDALRFTVAGKQQVTIDGFSSPDIRVLDVTNSNSVQELIGTVQPQKSGYGVALNLQSSGQRTLLAVAGEMARPVSLTANIPSTWRQPANGADLIILTRRDFFAALGPLRSLRQKQGYSVALVDIEDVYDEFSYGQKTPQAVKDFCAYASANWKKSPRFVMLAGDASLDPKNYLGFGDSDFVPTRLVDTELMETASDDWFVDFNGDGLPDMAIGRLPVRSAEEALSLATKIAGYDGQRSAGTLLLVTDHNDTYDFESASNLLRGLIPPIIRVETVDRAHMDDATAKAMLIDAINRGQLIVNYAGHGSVNQWRGNILTSEDAAGLTNSGQLSLFVMMTCLNGYFQDAALDSLGESLLKAEHGGAVAVWGSSGMTTPDIQSILNQQAYRMIFNGTSMTIGEATARAKAAVTNGDVRRTWILLGDPTTRLSR